MASNPQMVTNEVDPWVKGRMQDLFDWGYQNVDKTPYTPAPPGVAGMQPMQLAAQDFLSRQLLGQAYPYQSPPMGGPWNPFTPHQNAPAPAGPMGQPQGQPPAPGGVGNYEDEFSGIPGGYRPMFGGVPGGIPDIAPDDNSNAGPGAFPNPDGFERPSGNIPGPGGPAMAPTGIGPSTGILEAQQAAGVARGISQGGASPMVSGGNLMGGINMYRDPFEDQVVGQALSDIDRSRQLAQVGNASNATLSGAFGGDRHAIVEAETNRAAMEQAARTASQLRSQGFSRAADLAQSDASRGLTADLSNQAAFFTGRGQQLQGAGLLSSLGGDVFNRTLGTAGALNSMGGQQQNQAQAELSDQQNRFYEERDHGKQQLAFLQSLLTGLPIGSMQSMSGGRNGGAGFLGGAASGAGIGASFGPWGAGIGAGLGGLLGLL